MLQTLHIENYALIRETDVSFGPGFVVITGETGAGKSILLGALGLLLGQRADTAVLADKERKCVVEAHFNLEGLGLETFFSEADVDFDGSLILRREITPAGRSRAFANDIPVQLPFLKELAPRIVDIHSQHQTLTLADSAFRFSLLDSALKDPTASKGLKDPKDLKDPKFFYDNAYRSYITLKRDLEALTAEEAQNRKEQDYLQYQYDELANASLEADEQEALEQESQLLAHAEAVREGLATAATLLDDDSEASVLARLRQAKGALTHIAPYHPEAEGLLSRLESSLIELDDLDGSLQRLADGISYSPERQQQVDERLALLYRLEKKHGVDSVAALIVLRDDLDRRLQSIATLDSRIHALMEQVDKAFGALQQTAEALTASRREAGVRLSENLVPLLRDLGMSEARFRVDLVPADSYGPMGHDNVSFLFNANRGGELRDLSRVASGGELSRLMLAIKALTFNNAITQSIKPTLLLDEIDTGVSGDISVAVAALMRRMAQQLQVVAITHLPQIAARADQHLKVYKETGADSTVSRIRELDADGRLTEVATMLSSDPPTPAALQTARELMAPAQ